MAQSETIQGADRLKLVSCFPYGARAVMEVKGNRETKEVRVPVCDLGRSGSDLLECADALAARARRFANMPTFAAVTYLHPELEN